MPEGIPLFPEELATPGLVVRYLVFVFVAACGAIQIGAASGGFRGLLFLPARRLAALVGVALDLLAFAFFFSWYFSDENSKFRGLEGWEQTLLFLPAAAGGLLFTLGASSLLHRLRGPERGGLRFSSPEDPRRDGQVQGLEALREASYLEAWGRETSQRR